MLKVEFLPFSLSKIKDIVNTLLVMVWRNRNFFFFNLFILFIFLAVLGLCCCAHRLSLVAASGGYSSLRCEGFSSRWPLLLQSTGSGARASVVVACGLQ